MRTINAAGLLLIVALVIVLLGCESEELNEFGRSSKDPFKFIEHLEVKGECFEDHVKQPAPYTGSIVHWYNVTKDQHSRYGSVHHTKELDPEKFRERIQNPYKYQPPFTIRFTNLRQEDIEGNELLLPGISKPISSEDARRASYESTCALRVIRRLDYLPSLQKKTIRLMCSQYALIGH